MIQNYNNTQNDLLAFFMIINYTIQLFSTTPKSHPL
jgi:hypothetical protein